MPASATLSPRSVDDAASARLTRLVQSINDTARMSRTTVSLLLGVALYLAVTMLSASDAMLFYDGQIRLPQTSVSMPIVLGYLIAPPVFLYLHLQTVFLLRVLARKIRVFEHALNAEYPLSLPAPTVVKKTREDYRNLLSAFAFVQILSTGARPSRMARFLMWISMTAVPIILLLAIDLSFVRYQSEAATWSHHIVFALDLLFVVLFKREVFDRLRDLSSDPCPQPAVSQKRNVVTAIPRLLAWHIIGDDTMAFRQRALRSASTLACVLVVLFLVVMAQPPQRDDDREAVWRLDDVLPSDVITDGKSSYGIGEIWERLVAGQNWIDVIPCKLFDLACRYLRVRSTPAVRFGSVDNSDDIPDFLISNRNLRFADFRRAGLRELSIIDSDLHEAQFVEAELANVSIEISHLSDVDASYANFRGKFDLRRSDIDGANFGNADFSNARLRNVDFSVGRSVKGAKFVGAHLEGVNFQSVDLRNIDFSGAYFERSADLSYADVKRASFNDATLRHLDLRRVIGLRTANLAGADLTSVNLGCLDTADSDLDEAGPSTKNLRTKDYATLDSDDVADATRLCADLRRVNLSGAILARARMKGADLTRADLSGANFARARLESVDLTGADLSGADLSEARLKGADLNRAELANATLTNARMEGAILTETNLSGATLTNADLENSDLSHADVVAADLKEAELDNANLLRADFSRAILSKADLDGANLGYANFTDATLFRADLSDADLEETTLEGADLESAFMFRVKNLACAQLLKAKNWWTVLGIGRRCE